MTDLREYNKSIDAALEAMRLRARVAALENFNAQSPRIAHGIRRVVEGLEKVATVAMAIFKERS